MKQECMYDTTVTPPPPPSQNNNKQTECAGHIWYNLHSNICEVFRLVYLCGIA